jgi:hypothetical protein
MSKKLEIKCPCCSTKLVVDSGTGDVLSEERPKISERVSFEDAMRDVQSGAARRDKAFGEAFDRTRRLEDTLAKKFEEARKKAAKDPSKKPPNPFDLD